MSKGHHNETKRFKLFFLVALSHMSLEGYFQSTFSMIQHHKWSLTEIENMLPWERDIYVDKLIEYIKEENQRIKEQQRSHG